MELTTARLTIRPPRRGEGIRMAQYYQRNYEFLQPWYPKFRPEDSDGSAWERALPILDQERRENKALRLAFFTSTGEVAGVANLTSIFGHPSFRATLGYSLAQDWQGQGLMREALEAILPAAVIRYRLHRIEAAYIPRNERSGRVLEHLGFVREGYAANYLLINGVWEDHVLNAWTNPNWQ